MEKVRDSKKFRAYRRIDGEYALVECKYTEEWDLSKKLYLKF